MEMQPGLKSAWCVSGAPKQSGPAHICSPNSEQTVARPVFLDYQLDLKIWEEDMSFMQMYLYLEHNAYVHMEIEL